MGKLIAKESSPICWQTTIIVNNDYSKELLLFSTEGALDSEIQSNVSASKEANKAEQFWMYSLKQQSTWQAKSSKSIDSGIFQLPSIQLSDQSICLHLSTGSVFIFHSFQFPPLNSDPPMGCRGIIMDGNQQERDGGPVAQPPSIEEEGGEGGGGGLHRKLDNNQRGEERDHLLNRLPQSFALPLSLASFLPGIFLFPLLLQGKVRET